MIIKVPAGTIVKEASTGQVITDMSYENQREVVFKKEATAEKETSITPPLPCRFQNMPSRETR